MIVAHVGGVPVEEMLPMVSAIGTALALAVTWVMARVRGPRCAPDDRSRDADTGVQA